MFIIIFSILNIFFFCREAIFDWDPQEDPTEQSNPTLNTEDYVPLSVLGHLQVLFALMHYSNSHYIDPSWRIFIHH